MSFKKFSLAQDAPNKSSSGDKSKAAAQPAAQPGKKPAEVMPAPKS